ncbi:hypothetical protein K7432_002617 [Basidiobolus ranarum]|uniref:Uncharacterized protein n=1 Tax=Basidiobolus ranarum TaxID=34480 RepID=A0ABR2X172_9FUNG
MQLKQLSVIVTSVISAATPNDVCQYVFAPASLASTLIRSEIFDLYLTSVVEASKDPTSLDDAHGKDFNQVITSESGVNSSFIRWAL